MADIWPRFNTDWITLSECKPFNPYILFTDDKKGVAIIELYKQNGCGLGFIVSGNII